MPFKPDIIARIKKDFCENSDKAIEVLKKAIQEIEYLKTERVIRCIIYLSKGNLSELNTFIDTATLDTRDVMLWAEYEKIEGIDTYKRLRDFNKTFEESTNNVNE